MGGNPEAFTEYAFSGFTHFYGVDRHRKQDSDAIHPKLSNYGQQTLGEVFAVGECCPYTLKITCRRTRGGNHRNVHRQANRVNV